MHVTRLCGGAVRAQTCHVSGVLSTVPKITIVSFHNHSHKSTNKVSNHSDGRYKKTLCLLFSLQLNSAPERLGYTCMKADWQCSSSADQVCTLMVVHDTCSRRESVVCLLSAASCTNIHFSMTCFVCDSSSDVDVFAAGLSTQITRCTLYSSSLKRCFVAIPFGNSSSQCEQLCFGGAHAF